MRIRMYLRGLGIGIVVTALIMGLTSGRKQTMTDEEIKAKAAALGMVEQDSVLKPVISEETPQATAEEQPEENTEDVQKEVPEETPVETAEETAEETQESSEETAKPEAESEEVKEEVLAKAPENNETAEETKPETEEVKNTETAEQSSGNIKTAGTFTLEIAGGYGSEKVCALLEKGGLIESASDFDKYLCDHGYDHKIRTGKYTISAGSDYETIAKIITGRQ